MIPLNLMKFIFKPRLFSSSATNEWQTIVGLEIHVQLASARKLFSPAPNFASYCYHHSSKKQSDVAQIFSSPNTLVEQFDEAIPGVLPLLPDEESIKLALRTALLLGCSHVERDLCFDRKHYQYVDLPAGYQITQKRKPLGKDGFWKGVRIRQVHLEHDSAKLIYEEHQKWNKSESVALIDLNRCGVGLVEIVTEPDIIVAEQAIIFARSLHQSLVDAGITVGILAEGNFRMDVNISLKRLKDAWMSPRVEVKNLNSFSNLGRVIELEEERQRKILEMMTFDKDNLKRETRHYDEATNMTAPGRSKEEALDYRFIPEYDLPPIRISEELIETVKASLLGDKSEKDERLNCLYGLTPNMVEMLQKEDLLDLFLKVTDQLDPINLAKDAKKKIFLFMMNEFANLRKKPNISTKPTKDVISVEALGKLMNQLVNGSITNFNAKQQIAEALINGEDLRPNDNIVNAEEIMLKLSDQQKMLLDRLASECPKKVNLVRQGVESALNYFVGSLLRQQREDHSIGSAEFIEPKVLCSLVANHFRKSE